MHMVSLLLVATLSYSQDVLPEIELTRSDNGPYTLDVTLGTPPQKIGSIAIGIFHNEMIIGTKACSDCSQ